VSRPNLQRALVALSVALAVALVVLLGGGDARANMAKWWHEGEGHGPLVPQKDTDVRVDSEDLAFTIAPSLDRAEVTATYRMTNGGVVPTSAEVAFVVVAAEGAEDSERAPKASISLDGAPVAFRVVTDAELLAPALDAWLAAHPDIDRELARLTGPAMSPRYDDFAELRRLVPECKGECSELVGWYRQKKGASRRSIVIAATAAIPEEVAKLQRGWSTLATHRRLSWLAFPLDFAAGATRTVTVTYEHAAGSDTSKAVNQTFTYDYLLSPASRWARFGPLHVTVKVPPGTRLIASPALTRDGDTYRVDLPTLPGGELSLHVMSLKGLLFGMTQPAGYWVVLLAALSMVTIVLGVRLGRAWARLGSRFSVALGCIFGTGLVVGLADGVLMWLLSAAFPARAFGYGYGAAFGMVGAFGVFVVAGMAISGASAVRRRRA
jgi:hypothetical protein